jgi:AAA+ ATPase superfamily predicted ATPase
MLNLDVQYQRTLEALNLLLHNSNDSQSYYWDTTPHSLSLLAFAKEFCTIKVCGPRRSGHTSVANEFVKLFDDKVVIITPRIESLAFYSATHKTSVETLNRIRGSIIELKAVIVDMSSLISNKEKEAIYKIFSAYMMPHQVFYFIFLE